MYSQLTLIAPHPAQLVDWNLRYLDLFGRFEKVTQGPRGFGQGCRGIRQKDQGGLQDCCFYP